MVLALLFAGLSLTAKAKPEAPSQTPPPPVPPVAAEVSAPPAAAETPAPVPVPVPQVNAAAWVNGVPITREAVERQLGATRQQYLNQGFDIPPEYLETFREQIIANLIDQQLLYQEAAGRGFQAAPGEVEEGIADIQSQFASNQEYLDALAAQGFTEETLREDMEVYFALNHFVEESFLPGFPVTNAEVEAFYNENPDSFTEIPAQVRASHILIRVDDFNDAAETAADLQKARDILERLEGGEDFAALAMEFSESPEGREGGDLGFFERGMMVEEFEEAAFALAPGELSGVVQSSFGFHIIRVEEKVDQVLMELEPVRVQVQQYLQYQKMEEALASYTDQLRAAAAITIIEE
jgi:peptidyl-prolyl cis-trans isomerase C